MDGILWLLASWAIVAGICYLIVGKLGRGGGEALPPSGSAAENSFLLSSNSSTGGRSEWLNETLSWLWNNNAFSPAMTTILVRSLNDSAKKLASEESEILFEEGRTEGAPVKVAPSFSDVRAARGPKGHLSIKANMHIPSLDAKLITSQRYEGRMVVSNLEAVVSDVRGEIELRLAQIADEIYLMSCFSGRPSMNVVVVNKESHQPIDLLAAEDHIRKCILSCVVNFNLNECIPAAGTQSYADDFPPHPPSLNMAKYLSQAQRNEPRPRSDPRSVPNKLQISVIRAQRLGENDEPVHHPYVCVEMDEPAQKYTTAQSVNNRPYWEETFDFNLNPASDEVLFEIYDAGEDGLILDEPKFLGLAIVGLSELKQSPEPVHHLRLQGRPYKNDNVSGVLTIEVRFYHDASVPAIGKESQTVILHQPDGSRISEKESLDRRFIYDPHDNMENNFNPVPTKTTTVTVKAFKQESTEPPTVSSVHQSLENFNAPYHHAQPSPHQHTQQSTSPLSSDWNNGPLESSATTSPHPPDAINFEQEEKPPREQWLTPQNSTQQAEAQQSPYSPDEYPYRPPERKDAYPDYDRLFQENVVAAAAASERQPRDRERRKQFGEKRERSFFGELADRLRGRSRSKQRARSLDEHNPNPVLEEAISMPPSRDQSRTREIIKPHTGSATSIPDSGGWQKEAAPSTLVLEVGRPDQEKKFYYVPPTVANDPAAGRLLRRGKKLHLCSDHTFVAVKPTGRVTCSVCRKRISGNFMRQCYQCRDCRTVTHKQCHQRCEVCRQSRVDELKIQRDVDWAAVLYRNEPHMGEYISQDNL